MIGAPGTSGTVPAVDDTSATPSRSPARAAGRAPAPRTAGASRPQLFRHPRRAAIIGGTLFAAAALILGAVGSADTSDLHADQAVPKQVQTFSPAANAIVGPTAPIVVDLRDDLVADLTVCGPSPDQCTPIPFDQVRFVPSLGQITFRPTEKTDLTEYAAGPVTVRVDYRLQGSQGAEPGSFTWTFVAKA